MAGILDISVEPSAGHITGKCLLGNLQVTGVGRGTTSGTNLKCQLHVKKFILSQFCFSYLSFNHRPKRPWDTATSILECFKKASCPAFLFCFNLTLFHLIRQSKKSIRTGHFLQLRELVNAWPGICVSHQVVQVD